VWRTLRSYQRCVNWQIQSSSRVGKSLDLQGNIAFSRPRENTRLYLNIRPCVRVNFATLWAMTLKDWFRKTMRLPLMKRPYEMNPQGLAAVLIAALCRPPQVYHLRDYMRLRSCFAVFSASRRRFNSSLDMLSVFFRSASNFSSSVIIFPQLECERIQCFSESLRPLYLGSILCLSWHQILLRLEF
jgi:hypothetical protein